MLSFFRRVSKSKIGTGVMAFVLIGILAGFAMSDIRNFGSGDIGFGLGASTLAKVGDQEVSEREMNEAMQRRLQEIRRERPGADYAAIAGDFGTIFDALLDQRTLIAFANKFDFHISKRLVDAEITQIPQTKGYNGKFSDQAYQGFLSQQRLTDAGVRQILVGGLLQRLLLTPVATNAKISVGMATPYASMLLESREGQVAAIPLGAFTAGLNPTDADVQSFYSAHRGRYMIPEQRAIRIARIGPEQVAAVVASDQEVAAYYAANTATYGAKNLRSFSQVVVPDQAAAAGIASRAKAGGTLAAAAAPAGNNAAMTSVTGQTREAYAAAAGDKVAAAAFAAAPGAVVGPIQSDFGWVVVKVDSVRTEGGKSLAQARGEIAAKLTADKRKQAVEDLADKVQNAIDEGSNFAEAAAAAKLQVTTTPLLTAAGSELANPAFKLPEPLKPALKSGFESVPNDPPEMISLPAGEGYAMVAPAEVVAAAPAQLATIRAKVAHDWVGEQAEKRAHAVGAAIAAKAARGVPLAQALKEAGTPLPGVRPLAARRIQIATAQGTIPAPLQALFTLAQGKSRMITDPEGRGYYVVKVDKIIPGNALLQPSLIGRMQSELQQSTSDDYARQFVAAVRNEMNAKRNESAIKALKSRLTAGTN